MDSASLFLLLTRCAFSFKHLGTAATPHCSSGFVAHTGEAMVGACLSSLTKTYKSRCKEYQGKCQQ